MKTTYQHTTHSDTTSRRASRGRLFLIGALGSLVCAMALVDASAQADRKELPPGREPFPEAGGRVESKARATSRIEPRDALAPAARERSELLPDLKAHPFPTVAPSGQNVPGDAAAKSDLASELKRRLGPGFDAVKARSLLENKPNSAESRAVLDEIREAGKSLLREHRMASRTASATAVSKPIPKDLINTDFPWTR